MKTLGWHCDMTRQDTATKKTDPEELLQSTLVSFHKAREGVEVVVKQAKAIYAKMSAEKNLSEKGYADLKELQQKVSDNGCM